MGQSKRKGIFTQSQTQAKKKGKGYSLEVHIFGAVVADRAGGPGGGLGFDPPPPPPPPAFSMTECVVGMNICSRESRKKIPVVLVQLVCVCVK